MIIINEAIRFHRRFLKTDRFNRLCIFEVRENIQNAQKNMTNFINFVHTLGCAHDIIINVETPQYIIYFLLHPIISEIPSPKRTVLPKAVLFTLYF